MAPSSLWVGHEAAPPGNGSGPAVTLLGYYAKQNLGDDVFAHLFVQALRGRGWSRVFLPNAAPFLRRQLGDASGFGTRRAIDASQAVVVGGGGALGISLPGPREHEGFTYYWRAALYSRLRRRPLHWISVGAGPFTTDRARRTVRDMARWSASVILRDEPSRDELLRVAPEAASRVEVLADTALALDYDGLPRVEPLGLSQPCLGVNLCACTSFTSGLPAAEANREVIEAVRALRDAGLVKSVIWFSTAPWGDELLWAARGAQALPAESRLVFYEDDPWTWIGRLAECRSFISMKLHSGVFAAGMGVPLIGLPSHPKSARFYTSVGADEAFRELGSLRPGDIGPFVRQIWPGAAIRQRPAWQGLVQTAQRLWDKLPVPANRARN